jgi:carboxymethylenebutenolidase
MTPTGEDHRIRGVHGVPLTVRVPADEVRGGIVVVHEIYGVNEHIVAVTEALAAEGYLAVAPHLYHRVTDAPVRRYSETRLLQRSLTGQSLRHDLDDALDALDSAGVGPGRAGLLGYSMGGTVALWAAATMPIAAAVSYYGAGIGRSRWPGVPAGLASAANLRTPWLGLFGDRDTSVPVDEVEALRTAVESAAAAPPAAVVRYPEAGHGFASGPGARHHRAADAADAWARTIGWFDAHLG